MGVSPDTVLLLPDRLFYMTIVRLAKNVNK